MAEPVFFLEYYVAFKIVYVFNELPFRHNVQLIISISVFYLSLCLSIPGITTIRSFLVNM